MAVHIYSTDTDDGTLTVSRTSDGKSFEQQAKIRVGNAPRGAVKFTQDGRGYVCNCAGDTISEINSHNNVEVSRISVGPAPRGLAIVPGDRWALVSVSGGDYIAVVDLETRETVHRVSVGRDPRHMAVTPDGNVAFVAIWGSHYVSVLDLMPLKDGEVQSISEVSRIEIGDEAHPYSVGLQPNSDVGWVANTRAAYVSRFSVSERRLINAVEVGSIGSRAVAFTSDGDFALVTVENTSELLAVSTGDLQITRRVPVGPGPRGVAVDSADRAYIAVFERGPASNESSFSFTRNSLTVVNLSEITTSEEVRYREIPVGAGSCSVSVLDLGGS
ncbi:YncE family protein [Streptomyces sp. NRRL S-118]|uniref:YncE family protein n=1 Tax=Streptomyces sp. NRRL S-118 TaxID=1463881 RepID=UPI000D146CB2|nr:beta-propeller fold lactonase family protein [Streptomyces sp. NRRL S-118]